MKDLKTKEEILSEYFLVESEKTDEIKGWKVLGTIEGCASSSVSPILELKTDGEGWLCDFKIKLLGCGLVLASPEYLIEEDELVMEAVEKIWKVWGIDNKLQEILLQQQWDDTIAKSTPTPGIGTWTTTSAPYWDTYTVTCSNYSSLADSMYTLSTGSIT